MGTPQVEEKATPKADWKMPEKPIEMCFVCGGTDIYPQACNEGDGWELFWGCDLCGPLGFGELTIEEMNLLSIDWPFVEDDKGSSKDLRELGFEIV